MRERRLPHDWFPEPLPPNVELGPNTWLYSSFAFLHYRSRRPAGLRVGHDTGLYHGTFFDLGPQGEVVIGDYCTIVGAVISGNCRFEIGDYSFIAHEVVLADHFAAVPRMPGRRAAAASGPEAGSGAGGIVIGADVWIGARAVLLAPVRIGEGSVVGAAAVVTEDVPPFSVVAGNPARLVGASSRRRPA